MAQVTSTPYQALEWEAEIYHPVKGTTPTGNPATSAVGTQGQFGYQGWGYGQNATVMDPQRSVYGGGGGERVCCTRGARWCVHNVAAASTSGAIGCWNQWSPAIDPATCPTVEDPGQRIMWLQLFLLAGETASSITDAQCFALCPDDGNTSPSILWPPARATASGGFGVFNRTGAGGFRYASYDTAGVLLEAFNLSDNTPRWHVADFIIRQAVRDDATTPWLTFRWNGVVQFNERPFGHALLPTPQSMRAGAHGWGYFQGIQPSATTGMSFRYVVRIGRFHPDGYPQP